MLARVSEIESWRRWSLTDDEPAVLVDWLRSGAASEAMLAGTAFHKALELAQPGDYDELAANGFTFLLPEECAIALPNVRELRCFGTYGPVRVTGQVDALYGLRVEDHKTTANFNADGYLEGCQWRFYLDIFGADVFRWNVFELTPVRGRERTYTVDPPHTLEQVRYPGLAADCLRLAQGFHDFAIRHLPERMEQAA